MLSIEIPWLDKNNLQWIECPRKSNLLSACLLICQFFWCFDQQIWISRNFRCCAFLCPGFTMKSVCLSVVFFFAGFLLCLSKMRGGMHPFVSLTCLSRISTRKRHNNSTNAWRIPYTPRFEMMDCCKESMPPPPLALVGSTLLLLAEDNIVLQKAWTKTAKASC